MGPSVKHVLGVLEWFYMLNAKILFQNRTLAKDNFFIFLKILPTITSKNLPFLPWILFQYLSQPCGSCCKNIFKQRWIFLVKIKSRSHLLCWTKMARVYLGGSTVHTLNWQAKVTEQPIIRGYYISPGFIKKNSQILLWDILPWSEVLPLRWQGLELFWTIFDGTCEHVTWL